MDGAMPLHMHDTEYHDRLATLEEALNSLQPGARGWREVERPTRMAGEPCSNFLVFVCSVIVEHHVDQFPCWDLPLDRIEELDELLVPVTLFILADDRAVQNIECREQGGGAVALVVMCHCPRTARLHW